MGPDVNTLQENTASQTKHNPLHVSVTTFVTMQPTTIIITAMSLATAFAVDNCNEVEYGNCHAKCVGKALACYADAGKAPGSSERLSVTPAVIPVCNSAFDACQAICVWLAEYGCDMDEGSA